MHLLECYYALLSIHIMALLVLLFCALPCLLAMPVCRAFLLYVCLLVALACKARLLWQTFLWCTRLWSLHACCCLLVVFTCDA